MSFSSIARRLLKLRQRRGGGYSSYFAGDVSAVEQLAADIMLAAGVTGRAGLLAALEAATDALAASGVVAVASSGWSPPSSALIAHIDFENFANGQTIGGTALNLSNNNPNTIIASTKYAFSGTKSALFSFKDVRNGGQLLELDGNFSGDFTEVWFEYWIRVPDNFQHIDSPSSDNNKFFRIFSSAGYDTLTKLGCSMELAGRGDINYCDMSPEWTTEATDSLGSGGFTARGTSALDFITLSDHGQWIQIRWYVKAATALGGNGRAILRMWKNGVLVIDERPDNYTTLAPNSYRNFYLFGARNTGNDATGTPEPDQEFALDELSVWAQAA